MLKEKIMRIEQVHVKHKTWFTRITVGEGKKAKTFRLQQLNNGQYRVYIPFRGIEYKDFDTKSEALEFCGN